METFNMDRTLIAVFDSQQHAEEARRDLLQLGIPEQFIHVRAGSTDDIPHSADRNVPALTSEGDSSRRPGFLARLFGLDDDESGTYDEAMRRGSVVVAVDRVPEERADEASRVLSQHGAIDMDERAAGWRERGWSGYDQRAPQLSQDDLARERELDMQRSSNRPMGAQGETTRIPVVEEQLDVGKRAVERGGVRVFTRVVERPVEEQIALREEHARIERRPVDREATEADLGAAFQEGSIEIRETEEQAMVAKRARVVEEVEVGKESTERTETIRDTVRRSEVDVEDLPASRTTPADGNPRPRTGR
jgi:uncharacterized protein (TIGR02271 family)